MRIFTSGPRAITLGVRFHHISNGERSGSNVDHIALVVDADLDELAAEHGVAGPKELFGARGRGRGIYLRDRSTEPGCAGRIRVGAGIVEHTQRCITAMEEVLCAAQ